MNVYKTSAMEDSSSWRLPALVRVTADSVCYSYGEKIASDGAGALDSFIDLRNTSVELNKRDTKRDRAIVRFVSRWGALHLEPTLFEVGGRPEWRDPLHFYDLLPRAFYAAREIHAYVGAGGHKRVPTQLWADLYRLPLPYAPGLGEHSFSEVYWGPENDQYHVARQINAWLARSPVRPFLKPSNNGHFAAIQFNVVSLYDALVTQLLKELSGLSGWILCSNPDCRKSYAPTLRRPKSGQCHFCPSCRKAGIPKKIADREWKARKAASRPHGT